MEKYIKKADEASDEKTLKKVPAQKQILEKDHAMRLVVIQYTTTN